MADPGWGFDLEIIQTGLFEAKIAKKNKQDWKAHIIREREMATRDHPQPALGD